MIYTITADIPYTTTKDEINQFAKEHGCSVLKFQTKRLKSLGLLSAVTFQSKNLDYIQELADQLKLPHSEIYSLLFPKNNI